MGFTGGGEAVGETFAYDAIGRLTGHQSALTGSTGSFARTYFGQTSQVTGQLSGLVGTRWGYLSNLSDRRLANIYNSPGATSFAYTTTPEYDFTQIVESRNNQTWSYSYDQADRLTSAKSSLSATVTCAGVAVTYCYGYDAASNLGGIATPTGTTTVIPTATNAVASAGSSSFCYDANGNLLADYARTYAWDAENRLVGIAGTVSGSPYVAAIAYDGLNRRVAISTTIGGVPGTTYYGWCGQTLCQERSGSNVPMRRYLAEGEADAVQGPLIYGVDHLGAVRDVIADSSGQKLNHFDYDPYGNPTTATGSHATWTDFRDAGLFYQQTSGLYLATYRAYDPVVGRWLSRDPIGERGGINLYAYVGDNPLNGIDPPGFDESPAGGGTPGDPRAPGPPPPAPYEPGGSNEGGPSGTPCPNPKPPQPPPPQQGPPPSPPNWARDFGTGVGGFLGGALGAVGGGALGTALAGPAGTALGALAGGALGNGVGSTAGGAYVDQMWAEPQSYGSGSSPSPNYPGPYNAGNAPQPYYSDIPTK